MIAAVTEHKLAEWLRANPQASHQDILNAMAVISQNYYCVWSVGDIDWEAAGVDPQDLPAGTAEVIMDLVERRADYSLGFGHDTVRYAADIIVEELKKDGKI